MPESNHLHVTTRTEWRRWLEDNYQSAGEVWLIYHRKHTGSPRIPYNDAVEEALCFCWIDSTVKTIDQDRFAQRFTPRKSRSPYSQTNKERICRLIEQGEIMPEFLATVSEVAAEKYDFPPDIEKALRSNDLAWQNFQKYSGSYQRIRIAYVDSARKRPVEFEKRLNNLIRKTEQDKQFGFGIDAYY